MASERAPEKSENGPDPVAELIEELELHSAGFDLGESDAPSHASCSCNICSNNGNPCNA